MTEPFRKWLQTLARLTRPRGGKRPPPSTRLALESLEEVAAPVAGAIESVFAVGASDGSFRVVNAQSGQVVVPSFHPFDIGSARYTGLVEVAVGEMTGDDVQDVLVAAANPAGAAGLAVAMAGRVFLYDGADLVGKGTLATPVRTFVPFANTDGPAGRQAAYASGLNIAAADVDGDGRADLIAGTRGAASSTGVREYGRLTVLSGAAAGDVRIGGEAVKPFGEGYEKGVVVVGGDVDGDGKAEIAVTRGGPVAPTNTNETVKLKAYRVRNGVLAEINLKGDAPDAAGKFPALAPFEAITGANGVAIKRDARVAMVDPDGDGKASLVFTALDPVTDPTNTRVRVGVYDVGADGKAALVSVGSGTTPTTYLLENRVADHAVARINLDRNASSDLAVIVRTPESGIRLVESLTGRLLPPEKVAVDLNRGEFDRGVTIDGVFTLPRGTILFQDGFDAENGGSDSLNFGAFKNWVVTRGTVDVVTNMRLGYPQAGLLVDLDGSTGQAGRLETRTTFDLSPGTYALDFWLGYNTGDARERLNELNTMAVSLGAAYTETFSRTTQVPPREEVVHREFVVTAGQTGKLVFDHQGGDLFGLTIDNVLLRRVS